MAIRLALVAAVVALTLPAVASAETICVPDQTGCDSSVTDPQQALDLAAFNAGPDVIRLGATSYGTNGLTYDAPAAEPVEIDGVSTATTELHIQGNTQTLLKVTGGASATLKHLTINDPFTAAGSHPVGLDLSGQADVVDDVVINGELGMTGIAERDQGDLTVRNSKIMLAVSTSSSAVSLVNAEGRITDSDLTGRPGVAVTGSSATISRISVFSGNVAIDVAPTPINDSTLLVSSSILLPLNGTGRALRVQGNSAGHPASAIGRHLTIAGAGSETGAQVISSTSSASLTLDSSIIRSVSIPLDRQQGASPATVAIDYSDLPPGSQSTGSGAIAFGTHNVDVDPQFVSSTDYQLKVTSPVIDAGNPALDPIESPTDFSAFPRLVAAHGGCTRITDMGAYEVQHHEPTAAATASPGPVAAGTAVSFDASASCDSTFGDTLTYAWSFDDGAAATGAVVTHAFATGGTHTGTVTVTDSAAAKSTATATVEVNAPSGPPPPDPDPTPEPVFRGASLKGSRTLIVDRKGRFSWRFACRADSPATCHEKVRLKTGKQTIATATFEVLPGKAKTVRSRVTKRALKQLRRKHKLTAKATITSTGAPGATKVGHATVKLKLRPSP